MTVALRQGGREARQVPVRHPHDHVVHAVLTRLVNDGLEGRDQHLATFQTKALLRRPLPLQELLKPEGTKPPEEQSQGQAGS